MATTDRPVPIPWRERLLDFVHGPLPVLVWVGAVGVAAWLWRGRPSLPRFPAQASTWVAHLTAPRDGMVQDLPVRDLEDVTAGALVAVMDDSLLLGRIERERATLGVLQAELAAAVADEDRRVARETQRTELDWITDLRRYQRDEALLNLELLQITVDLETARLEHQRVETRTRRIRTLAETDTASAAELEDLELRLAELLVRVQSTEALRSQARTEWQDARARRAAFEASWQPDAPLRNEGRFEVLRAQLVVQGAVLDELALERQALLVRAPRDGRVLELGAGPGQTVREGELLVVLAGPRADGVDVFVPVREEWKVRPATQALISRASEPGVQRSVPVLGWSADVVEVPAPLRRQPQVPEYARRVRLEAPADLELVPGERIHVEFGGAP